MRTVVALRAVSFLLLFPGPAVLASEVPGGRDGLCASDRTAEAGPSTYVFYFDQSHLTAAGRVIAGRQAREMIPRLVRGGSMGILMNDARDLAVLAGPTPEASALLAAVDRLENDPTLWDMFSTQEDARVDEVAEILNDPLFDGARASGGAPGMALARASSLQAEEASRLERSLDRIAIVLDALAETEGPRTFIYFADTLRAKPGDHYLQMVSPTLLREKPVVRTLGARMERAAEFGDLSLQRLARHAASSGIRFCAAESAALASAPGPGSPDGVGARGANNATISASVRERQARDTLESLEAATEMDDPADPE